MWLKIELVGQIWSFWWACDLEKTWGQRKWALWWWTADFQIYKPKKKVQFTNTSVRFESMSQLLLDSRSQWHWSLTQWPEGELTTLLMGHININNHPHSSQSHLKTGQQSSPMCMSLDCETTYNVCAPHSEVSSQGIEPTTTTETLHVLSSPPGLHSIWWVATLAQHRDGNKMSWINEWMKKNLDPVWQMWRIEVETPWMSDKKKRWETARNT